METQAPYRQGRKCDREVRTGRKPSSGHAHLPEAPEVYLKRGCCLTGSLRRRTDGRAGGVVSAEAEGRSRHGGGREPRREGWPRARR